MSMYRWQLALKINNPGYALFLSCKIPINVVIYSYYHTKFGKSQHAKLAKDFFILIAILFEGN